LRKAMIVVKASSSLEASEILRELKERGKPL
jgi:hypothetical protein